MSDDTAALFVAPFTIACPNGCLLPWSSNRREPAHEATPDLRDRRPLLCRYLRAPAPPAPPVVTVFGPISKDLPARRRRRRQSNGHRAILSRDRHPQLSPTHLNIYKPVTRDFADY